MHWIGIELDKPVGDNDGSWGGARRFQCRSGHGLFVHPSAVLRIMPEPAQYRLYRGASFTIPFILLLIALLPPLSALLFPDPDQEDFAARYAQQTVVLSKVLNESSIIFDSTTTLTHTFDLGHINLPWYDNNVRVQTEARELALGVRNLSEAATLYFTQCQSVTSHNLHRNRALQTRLNAIIDTRRSLSLVLARVTNHFFGFPPSEHEEDFEANLRDHQTKVLHEAQILHELDSSLRVNLDKTSIQLRSVLDLIHPAFSTHIYYTEDPWQVKLRLIARFFGVYGGRSAKSNVSGDDMLAQLDQLEKFEEQLIALQLKINIIESPTQLLAATSRELVRMLDRGTTAMQLSPWLLDSQLRVVEDANRRMQLKPSFSL